MCIIDLRVMSWDSLSFKSCLPIVNYRACARSKLGDNDEKLGDARFLGPKSGKVEGAYGRASPRLVRPQNSKWPSHKSRMSALFSQKKKRPTTLNAVFAPVAVGTKRCDHSEDKQCFTIDHGLADWLGGCMGEKKKNQYWRLLWAGCHYGVNGLLRKIN